MKPWLSSWGPRSPARSSEPRTISCVPSTTPSTPPPTTRRQSRSRCRSRFVSTRTRRLAAPCRTSSGACCPTTSWCSTDGRAITRCGLRHRSSCSAPRSERTARARSRSAGRMLSRHTSTAKVASSGWPTMMCRAPQRPSARPHDLARPRLRRAVQPCRRTGQDGAGLRGRTLGPPDGRARDDPRSEARKRRAGGPGHQRAPLPRGGAARGPHHRAVADRSLRRRNGHRHRAL